MFYFITFILADVDLLLVICIYLLKLFFFNFFKYKNLIPPISPYDRPFQCANGLYVTTQYSENVYKIFQGSPSNLMDFMINEENGLKIIYFL